MTRKESGYLDIVAQSAGESGKARKHPNDDRWQPEIQRACMELEQLFKKSGCSYRSLALLLGSPTGNPGYGWQVRKRLRQQRTGFHVLSRVAAVIGYRARIVFEPSSIQAPYTLLPRRKVGRPPRLRKIGG